MNASTAPSPEPASWRLRLRLLYRAYRYRWKNDPAEIAFVRAHVRPGSIALDVGAHKGGYTYWLAHGVGPNGHVYAFEPQPRLAAALRASLDPSRVTVENAGVSDREGDGGRGCRRQVERTSLAVDRGFDGDVRALGEAGIQVPDDRNYLDLPCLQRRQHRQKFVRLARVAQGDDDVSRGHNAQPAVDRVGRVDEYRNGPCAR